MQHIPVYRRLQWLVGICLLALSLTAQSYDPALYSSLEWRSIGPYRGGRSAAVTGVPGKPNLYYFGAAGGGVWKTQDGGQTWVNISDGHFGGSIGAVAVSEADPNVIYVGGGEVTVRGNVSYGYGVYKSVDAGKNWQHIGLPNSRHVPRIRIHPDNPDLVYAAVLGDLFKSSEERGVYRSKDGGQNWERILFANADAGAVDLLIDPTNPRILYASTWRVRRTPYSLESGGEGSALWKSTDGGDTWTAINMEAHASNLIDIFFFNEQEGFVVGGFSEKDDPVYEDVVPVVLHTTDGGQTWENRVANLEFEPGEWGWKINFVNNMVGYISLESFDRGAVLKTTDGGKTWTRLPINDQQGNANLEGVGFITEDRGWVGGWGNADFTAGYTSATIDGGQTWTDANEVGRFINRFRFIGDPVTVGYASGRMVYKYNPTADPEVTTPQLTGVGSVSTARMIKTAGLQSFTNTAIISVQIPEGAKHAWLNIWNRFGLEVRLLLDESNPTAGERQLLWDGLDDNQNSVSSGVYIFRLTVDDSSDSGSFYLDRDL